MALDHGDLAGALFHVLQGDGSSAAAVEGNFPGKRGIDVMHGIGQWD
jgi:hypothetical protein